MIGWFEGIRVDLGVVTEDRVVIDTPLDIDCWIEDEAAADMFESVVDETDGDVDVTTVDLITVIKIY